MPIGEVVAEVIVRPLLEIVVGGFLYFFGWLTLMIISIGRLDLDSLSNLGRKPKNKAAWYTLDYNLWTTDNQKTRKIRAEFTCCIGFLSLGLIGIIIYFLTK